MTNPLHVQTEVSVPFGLAHSTPVMVWTAALGQGCTYFNEQRLAFTGRGREVELGFGWLEAVHPEERERCRAAYDHAMQVREPFQAMYRLQWHDGSYRWVLDTGVPQFDSSGAFIGFAGSVVDVHEQYLLEE